MYIYTRHEIILYTNPITNRAWLYYIDKWTMLLKWIENSCYEVYKVILGAHIYYFLALGKFVVEDPKSLFWFNYF